IKPGDLLYDLGCGDGRIVIAAAKTYGIQAIGVDIDPVRISESEANAAEAGVTGKVKFINKDLFETDFSDASVVTMYLLTSVNLRLRPKLLADLRPGTRLVSHRFEMGEWRPDKSTSVPLNGGEQRWVYYWVVPANVTGRWEWNLDTGNGRRLYTFTADQLFQVLGGTVSVEDREFALSDGRLEGVLVHFRLDEERGGRRTGWLYEGEVQGNSIRGTARPAEDPKAKPIPWTASRNPLTIKPLDAASTDRRP
ncbi:MAG: class I SAM-dependent methyltransferase, partial [Candidatus Aminicenantes bacterium]|nr:class I SAM-dependent methyltransferase [Candidatus Aminicenantes bacterium]